MPVRPIPTADHTSADLGSRMPAMRLVILALVIVVGLAGITWGLSPQFDRTSFVVVAVATLTTLPSALLIYLYGQNLRYSIPFVVYADIGITVVLFASRSPFDALPGIVLLMLVSLYAGVYVSGRILAAQLAFAAAILVVLSVLSVQDGVDGWLVLSRALTLLTAIIVPVLLKMHIDFLTEKRENSRRDGVSGLLNRRGLDGAVARFDVPRGVEQTLGAAVVHLRDFVQIERRLGRATSHDLVAETSTLLTDALPDAIVARTQPGEFACVWLGSADDVAERLAAARTLVESTRLRSATVSMTCTSSTVPVDYRTTVTVALGKTLTAAAFLQYGDAVAPRSNHHVAELIADGGPAIVFQPVLSVSTGRVMGYEALSRFPSGHGTTQSWFLDAAADGLQIPLELAAVRRAVAASRDLPTDVFLAVNVSATTIVATDLVPILDEAAECRRVVVEITEHDLVSDYTALGAALDHLRDEGLSISVDDVGAGYSGLRQLVEIKPDVIKLDASIVRGIDTDPMRRAAASALTTFAAAIGAECVYEGIETPQELESARSLGADMVQGFLLGRPTSTPILSRQDGMNAL
ncbi:GGDEF domain-containing protein [Rhodococcus sp. BP-349]|uniref:EAL domain-containing protein n=1 Tax=unclassified Rhodococcus (in: high G+C Gram-positive bacteria) TaxID=192944 RepID=UPI001C9B3D79|nr:MULTISPECIES: bifunctional diguanylate cyclase/phosphodiesterase [unclassified Rhodococcus (in: high G+C Gram-positive bacteria)]MBY6537496.1 GGDEF domain-containing protein [Rhodococcus sp. BP-363]MBY6541833.1 GGDEF domain-containing protein [Rhodococcus sp. BP-369]MBY6561063.1 GGDEF domain-containing protein [Rhodococcus sp. BP-370]MBY6575355.1 GGDEF domain-containing protein [Rhodococcus sp. BP-364]MBY6584656.1 GGDEF domain-containing protein [Rhodococcus sp. BP-358]